MVIAKGWGGGGEKWGDVGQRAQTSSCKISSGDQMYSMVILVSNTVFYT